MSYCKLTSGIGQHQTRKVSILYNFPLYLSKRNDEFLFCKSRLLQCVCVKRVNIFELVYNKEIKSHSSKNSSYHNFKRTTYTWTFKFALKDSSIDEVGQWDNLVFDLVTSIENIIKRTKVLKWKFSTTLFQWEHIQFIQPKFQSASSYTRKLGIRRENWRVLMSATSSANGILSAMSDDAWPLAVVAEGALMPAD